jgi:predicted permease
VANLGHGVLDAIQRRSLPYADSEQLSFLFGSTPRGGLSYLSHANYRDLAAALGVDVTTTAASSPRQFLLEGRDVPRLLRAELVAGDFFPSVGLQPLLGRSFTPDDDQRGAVPVGMISESLFRSAFGADRTAIGRPARLNGRELRVIGVVPASYRGIFFEPVDVWLPLAQAQHWLGERYLDDRALTWLAPVVRIRSELHRDELAARLETLSLRLRNEHPDTNRELSFVALPLRSVYFNERTITGLRYFFWAANGVFALTLLNLLSLMLSALVGERRSMAVRGALGATRSQMLILAGRRIVPACLAGTGLGIIIAGPGTPRLIGLSDLPPASMTAPSLTTRSVGFTALLTLVAVLVLMAAAAVVFSRMNLALELRAGQRQLAASHRKRGLAAILEVALAVALVSGSVSLLRSQRALVQEDMGFESTNLLATHGVFVTSEYEAPSDRARIAQRAREAIGGIAGINAVSTIGPALVPDNLTTTSLILEGSASMPESPIPAYRSAASAGTFETLGIPLIAGRVFEEGDETSGRHVAIVSQLLAVAAWQGDAVGRRFQLVPERSEDPTGVWWEVVGVVGNVRGRGVTYQDTPDHDLYLPFSRVPPRDFYLLARTTADPAVLAPQVQDAIRALDPSLPRFAIETMKDRIAGQASDQRFVASLLGGFALIGLLVAGVGIHGVVRLWFDSRRSELAIRLALGAAPRQLATSVLAQALRISGAGLALGAALAYAGHRLLSGMLFGVTFFDPWLLLSVLLAVGVVALLAAAAPMRSALAIDPVEGLRFGEP